MTQKMCWIYYATLISGFYRKDEDFHDEVFIHFPNMRIAS